MRKLVLLAGLSSVLLLALGSYALADGGSSRSNVRLIGYQEVPSVSTAASGEFKAKIRDDRIEWTLSYRDLEGAVQQAHIHFGQKAVNGGITVFLCTNLGNGPAGIQPCPAPPATITGTILAADVSPNIPATAAARTQGINTGEFAELVAAIRAGVTYANVHSTTWPGGEIRAQLNDRRGGDDD
jgi:CHRD domain